MMTTAPDEEPDQTPEETPNEESPEYPGIGAQETRPVTELIAAPEPVEDA
jgi:hypothetical protein